MNTRPDNLSTSLARALAPEEIRPGQYVAVLSMISERALSPWECDNSADAGRVIRIVHLPPRSAAPMRVVDVCLPFVLVRTALGKPQLLDVRRFRLALVSDRFGQQVFEHLAAAQPAPQPDGATPASPGSPAAPGGASGPAENSGSDSPDSGDPDDR